MKIALTYREDARAWIGSFGIHLAILLLMLLFHVSDEATLPEWIEVAWGNYGSAVTPSSASVRPGSSGASASADPSRNPVKLPERQLPRELDEPLTLPKPEKKISTELPKPEKRDADRISTGEKDRGVGIGTGEKEAIVTPGSGQKPGESDDPRATGGEGQDVGAAVSYSVEWAGGGTRRLLSGGPPEYPAGVNVEAQIKIQAIVEPDGSVRGMQPLQKGNAALENAAMTKMRLWRFEPLSPTRSQIDQTCLVTFNFRLE